ncbi:hypothetical protein PF008_g706 [Phytophthora fragariae]|uniref:DDE Tnp4 domain-containing protein n=1 Tax=Phytophthora fragariae TaxID=53985 RepID=A0A6G0SPB0_9STRA|nr:hypothetical protein PF008_g706 [Phytophthora fragariae]
MPPPIALMRLAMQTCATAVALTCGFLMHRDVRMNVYTLDASIDFESMLDDPTYNEWFCRHLRCLQTSFVLLCKMLRLHFAAVPYKKYSFERGVACMLFHFGSSGGYRETARVLGVSKVWCIMHVNALVRVLNSLRAQHIKLPTSQDEWETIAADFSRKRGFPFCGALWTALSSPSSVLTTSKDGIAVKVQKHFLFIMKTLKNVTTIFSLFNFS